MTDHSPTSNEPATTNSRVYRKHIAQHGQYDINHIIQIDGLQPTYPVYGLQMRGHTSVIVGDTPQTTTGDLKFLTIRFSPVAVHDIGVELLRASHIRIPLNAIEVLENITDASYSSSREIENPLNDSSAVRNSIIRYPD